MSELIEKQIGDIKDIKPEDIETQREVYRLLYERLKRQVHGIGRTD